MEQSCRTYVRDLQAALGQLPWSSIDAMIALLHDARLNDRQVFIFGNGGSAATASHMACDLGKNTVIPGRPRFRAIALVDNMEAVTAIANDIGYESVFTEQLANFVRRQDVVIAISTSGNSPNVLHAVEYAIQAGATTVGLTGSPGGRLARMVHIPVVVASERADQVEDLHLIIEHMLVQALRQGLQPRPVQQSALAPLPLTTRAPHHNGNGATANGAIVHGAANHDG